MLVGGRNPNAWNNWYHCVGTTYGTWLRGDPRGFRTFRHRCHVEGDYRNPPPPGVWAPIFEFSRKRLRWPPVILSPEARDVLCRALVDRLKELDVEIIAFAVARNHFHALARFPALDAETIRRFERSILTDGRDPAPRHWLGMARREGTAQLKAALLNPPSPVWAVRPKCEPVEDRPHQVNTAQYIRGHRKIGAAVYYLGDYWKAWD